MPSVPAKSRAPTADRDWKWSRFSPPRRNRCSSGRVPELQWPVVRSIFLKMQPERIAVISFDQFPFEARALRLARAAADAGFLIDAICTREAHETFRERWGKTDIYRLPLKRDGYFSFASKVLAWCVFLLLAGM